jgi:alkaline phosphatase
MRSGTVVIGSLVVLALSACSSGDTPAAVSTATNTTEVLTTGTGTPDASGQTAGATVTSTADPSAAATTTPPTSAPTVDVRPEDPPTVFIGAGDIAHSGDDDAATARLIEGYPDATVFTTGDNAYEDGTAEQFAEYYEPTWGVFRDRTKPTIGNHDARTDGAAGYFGYFGDVAGTPGEGWYSYDLRGWHVIHLNSECGDHGLASCDDQMTWLQADLAATDAACMIAVWHKPLFNSGNHGPEESFADEWQVLDDAGADIVLNGHDHNYQRYVPQDAAGRATPDGMREFVVGSGGASVYEQTSSPPNLEQFYEGYGVLKLELSDTSYAWTFLPTEGDYTDAGSASCVDG